MVAVMAASLYASLRIAFRAQADAETNIEPSRTAEVVMEFLRGDLQNLMPPNPDAAYSLIGPFQGLDSTDDRGAEADDVTFYTTAEAPDRPSANGDIKKIELAMSQDHSLVRRVTRNLLAQVEPEPVEEVLCRNVAGFNLRFYDGEEWQPTWDSQQLGDTLPAAVEVTLTLKRVDARNGVEKTYRFTRVFVPSCAAPATGTVALPG